MNLKEEQKKANDVIPRMKLCIERFVYGERDARKRLSEGIPCIIPLRAIDFPEKHIKSMDKIFKKIGNISIFKLNEYDQESIKRNGTLEIFCRKIKNKSAIKIIKELYEIYNDLINIKNNS